MSALADLALYIADRIPELEGRVYPLLARQGEPAPHLAYQQDSDTPGYELSGEAGYAELMASYTVWSLDMTQCEQIMDALRVALTGIVDLTIGDTKLDVVLVEGGEADGFEVLEGQATGLLSKTQQFFVRYFRTVATAPGV